MFNDGNKKKSVRWRKDLFRFKENFILGQVFRELSFFKPTTPSCIERWISHTGNEKYPAVGSSGEYWSISESLNQGFVEMKDVNRREGYDSCKVCAQRRNYVLFEENLGPTKCQQLR